MFATLLGALPRPTAASPGDAAAIEDELVVAAIRAQEAAGLEPITDGRLRTKLGVAGPGPSEVVAAWRFAAEQTDRAVKQAIPGPYSIARREAVAGPPARGRPAPARHGRAVAAAAANLRETIDALVRAGCPLIEIEETDAHLIGEDEGERELFRNAHRQLVDGVTGTHLSLSIVGASAWSAGLETIVDAPYASLAVDLIAGPDNWNLVTRLAPDRGVIAGALPARDSPADAKEVLLWAARYAAASGGRGLDRVGIGSAGSWANLTWAAAVEKMQRLGDAARLASMPPGETLVEELDPRAVSARRAALGHHRGRSKR